MERRVKMQEAIKLTGLRMHAKKIRSEGEINYYNLYIGKRLVACDLAEAFAEELCKRWNFQAEEE